MTNTITGESGDRKYLKKIEHYLKRPESLQYEQDKNFIENFAVMESLALLLKNDSCLAYFPRDLKNNEEFMLRIISQRPEAYRYAGLKLSKDPEFAIKAIQVNPGSLDAVFFKHENFFNNLSVIHEAIKHPESDFFGVSEEINEHIHKKNKCSKEDLLEMFSSEQRCGYVVRCYASQVEVFIDDNDFFTEVSRFNEFDFSASDMCFESLGAKLKI